MTTIKRGDIIQLGRHRLMCGDATDKKDVSLLFCQDKADCVVTSPPYLQQRKYGLHQTKVINWSHLVSKATLNTPCSQHTQMLVNLGICHHDGQWVPYWEPWLDILQAYGWRRFGFYVWDTNIALPGDAHGRLLSRHEFIFHLNKERRGAFKVAKTIGGGKGKIKGYKVACSLSDKDKKFDWNGRLIQMTKPLDSIIKSTRSHVEGVDHPAKFPTDLARQLMISYSLKDEIVYDPFLGSGTTILACHQNERRGYGMEIEPYYCQIAVDRIRKEMARPAGSA